MVFRLWWQFGLISCKLRCSMWRGILHSMISSTFQTWIYFVNAKCKETLICHQLQKEMFNAKGNQTGDDHIVVIASMIFLWYILYSFIQCTYYTDYILVSTKYWKMSFQSTYHHSRYCWGERFNLRRNWHQNEMTVASDKHETFNAKKLNTHHLYPGRLCLVN